MIDGSKGIRGLGGRYTDCGTNTLSEGQMHDGKACKVISTTPLHQNAPSGYLNDQKIFDVSRDISTKAIALREPTSDARISVDFSPFRIFFFIYIFLSERSI